MLVHYKCWQYLEENLLSLQNQSVSINQIIIINNDNSINIKLNLAKFNGLPILLISNENNIGFGAACNQAIDYISNDDSILFCNPDVKIPFDGIEKLLISYDNSQFNILGCQQTKECGKLQRVYGVFPSLISYFPILGSLYKKNRSKKFMNDHGIKKVDWVTGAVLLVSKEDFKTLGGFDENYFMFMEDVDLCKRANKLMMNVGSTTNTEWIHHHGKSSTNDISDRIKTKTEAIKSKHIYINKHFGYKKIPGHFLLFMKYMPELILALVLYSFLRTKEIKVKQKVALNLFSELSKILLKPLRTRLQDV